MQQSTSTSFRITLSYMVFSTLWILFSDLAVQIMFKDPAMITRAQSYKGVFFVLITGFLLFVLVLKNYQRLERVFQLDGLTGLLNHHLLKLQLQRRLSSLGPGERLGVSCMDINNFKEINETIGFDKADNFLLELSNGIQKLARPGSIIGRLPPDQFISAREIPFDQDLNETAKGFVDLFHRVAKKFDINASCRLGLAEYPRDGLTAKELLAAATEAVESAKQQNQLICFHDREVTKEAARRRMLVHDLGKAITASDLSLVYQPKYVIDTKAVCGCEVLIRWNHETLGFITPAEFIPLAEENGLMSPITLFVLSQAQKELSEAGLIGGVLKHISVNVSASEFNEINDMKALQSHLKQLGQLSSCLRIEITETATLKDTEQSRCIIDTLREDGVSISIDDFGTGYTSLAMLKDFDIDEIKIDRSFVDGMEKGQRALTIVEAIIGMARTFGINVIAEGVETEEQIQHLQRLGCNEVQGYLLGTPMPIEGFKKHISQ